MIKKIYIAGPLFNDHERHYLEDIAKKLEDIGYKCFLPHRDQSGISEAELEMSKMNATTKDKIFNNDLNGLKRSDLTVALITGWDIDSGTAAEIGYTYANGKPIIAIDALESRFRNLFVVGMISKIVNNIDELTTAIDEVLV